jgi:hypothetical protein
VQIFKQGSSPVVAPTKLADTQKAEARRRRAEGATRKELAKSYDVGLATISRVTA